MPSFITQKNYDQLIESRRLTDQKHRAEFYTWRIRQALKSGKIFACLVYIIGSL